MLTKPITESIKHLAIKATRANSAEQIFRRDIDRVAGHLSDTASQLTKQGWDVEFGFITSTDRYVNRREAYNIAEAANQLVDEPIPRTTLFLVDLKEY